MLTARRVLLRGLRAFRDRPAIPALVLLVACATAAVAAQLQPRTLAAFERYSTLTEARMDAEIGNGSRFIWIDGLAEAARKAAEGRMRRGEVFIERVRTRAEGKELDAPDGMIHHWVGSVFVPGVRVRDAVAMLRDYDRHAEYFSPNVARSKLLASENGRVRFYLRFFVKKVLSVTLNTEHEGEFVTVDPSRTYARFHSTRIAEVEHAGTPQEREKPIGNDSGFMWRMNTYWRFAERDGGTYVQCESISLSRDIPFGLGWIIRPFVTEVPRDSLQFTLGRTRAYFMKGKQVPPAGVGEIGR